MVVAGRPRVAFGRPIATSGAAAFVLGAAPHVLHHVGPLAGAAVVAGATGQVVFGGLAFVFAFPLLQRLHRRSGSWHQPALALALMAAAFTFSTLVVGPALSGEDEERGVSPATREAHDDHHP